MSSFRFNGVRKDFVTDLIDTVRPVFAPVSRNILSIPGRPGAVLQSTDTEVRVIPVPVLITADDSIHLQNRKEELATWLITDDVRELIFDDEPDRIYYAIVDGNLDLNELVSTGKGTITFICPDPYKYGESHSVIAPTNASSVSINTIGHVETYPVITATLKKTAEFIAFAPDEDKVLMIGESPEVDVPVVPYEQLILHDELSTLSPWTAVNSSDLDGGTATMPMSVSGGYRFYVPDYGSGSLWHGAAVKRALPEQLQDFLIQAKFTQRSDNVKSLGRVELYLLDATGDIIGKLQIRDGDLQRYVNTGVVTLGSGLNSKDIIMRKDTQLNNFQEGTLRIRRVGQSFSAEIARVDPVTKRVTFSTVGFYTDVDNLHHRKVAQIMINISAHGTSPPSIQYADEVKVWKVNTFQETEIPIIFHPGDVVEIDMNTNKIYKNGLLFMKYLQPGSDFFSLKPGENTVKIFPPDAADIKIDYRSRWY